MVKTKETKTIKKVAKKTVKTAQKPLETKQTVKKATKTVVKSMPKTESKSVEKFAVIAISGVQLKVYEGKEYEVKKLLGKKGDKIEIKEVLLISDGKDTKIGKPYIKDAVVKLEITSQTKGKKVEAYTYSAKSRHRRNYGFRESITKVIVKSI